MFCAVIFDFDGTVADTGEGIFNSIRYALKALGKPLISEESMRRFVGPSLRGSFMRECGMTEAEASLAVETYRTRYSDIGLFELDVYDGITDVLRSLRGQGTALALASSKPQPFLDRIVNKFDLAGLFDVVAGSDPAEIKDDKSAIISRTVAALNVPPSEALMVGDRKYDIDGAKKLGLKCAAVLYGYGSREEFEEHGADFIVADPRELERLVLSNR